MYRIMNDHSSGKTSRLILFNSKYESDVMIDEMEVFVQNYIDYKLTGYSL